MDETDGKLSQLTADAQRTGFYKKFIGGELGLAKTYWQLGVVPGFCVGIALRTVSSFALAYWIGTAFVCYQLVLLVALWNAGKKYQGFKLWPVLAFVVVMLSVFRNFESVLASGTH